MRALKLFAAAATVAFMGCGAAWAGLGQPSPWQLGLQEAGTPVMQDIVWFHDDLLLVITTAIAAFVLALLIIIMVRFNARANPTPSRTTHNTLLEVAWTAIPVLILVVIAIPSFKLLFYQLNIPPADVTRNGDAVAPSFSAAATSSSGTVFPLTGTAAMLAP